MDANNGRVTIRYLFEELEKRDDRIDKKLEKIIEKLDDLPGLCRQVDTNSKEIDRLRKGSDMKDTLLMLATIIGSALGITIKAP